jgi:hypothetical protein
LEVCGTGSPGQTVQRYTVASTGSVSPTSGTRQYWRFAVNASWSAWQEVHTAGNSLPYLGRVEAGADLNNYANRGMWAVAASSVASGGTNFPVANSGWLLVYCEAAAGAAAGTNVIQVYIASNSNRQFFRSLVGGTWSGWEEVVRSSMMGAANGVATLDINGKITASQTSGLFLPSSQKGLAGGVASLDEDSRLVEQHAFCEIVFEGTDANAVVLPGFYVIQSDANATAALNWPIQLAGTLLVEATLLGNMQVTQTYTTRNGAGGAVRTFKRVRFSSNGTWGAWQEVARIADLSVIITQLAQAFGVGQTRQGVGASRAPGVNYPNSTGRPIIVSVSALSSGANGRIILYVDGNVEQDDYHASAGVTLGGQITVPAGSSYQVVVVASSIVSWWEYR